MLRTSKIRHNFLPGKVVIEDEVFIGMNALIVKPVTIGKGTVIAAGAVVTRVFRPTALLREFLQRLLEHEERSRELTIKIYRIINLMNQILHNKGEDANR